MRTAHNTTVGPSPKRDRNRLTILIVVGVGIAVIGVALGWFLTRGDHSGGDPGGQILRALRPATEALPADARVIDSSSTEPYWDDCHGERYTCATPGWTLVGVEVHFATAITATLLLRHASSVLIAQGWCLSNQESTPLGPSMTWARMVPGGGWAWTSLSPSDMGPGTPLTWDLAASASPAGDRAVPSPLSNPPCLATHP